MNTFPNHPLFYPPVSLILEESSSSDLFDAYLLVDYSFFRDSRSQKRTGIRANLRVVDNREVPIAYLVIPEMVGLVEKASLPKSEHFFTFLWPKILNQLEWERIKSGPSDDPGYSWTSEFSNNRGLFRYTIKNLEVGMWALEGEEGGTKKKKLTKKQEAGAIVKELVSGKLQYKKLAGIPVSNKPPTLVLAPVSENWSDNKGNEYNLSFVIVLHIPDIESFRFYEDKLTKNYLVKVKAKVSGYFLTIGVSHTSSEIYANGKPSPSGEFSGVKPLSATRQSKWGLTVGLVNQEVASEYLGQRYGVRTFVPESKYEVHEEEEDFAWECTVGLTRWGNAVAQQEAGPEASEVEKYRFEVAELVKRVFREVNSYQENRDAFSERLLLCLGVKGEGTEGRVWSASPFVDEAIFAYQQASFLSNLRAALSSSKQIKSIPFANFFGRFLENMINRARFTFETLQAPPLSSASYISGHCLLNIGVKYRTFALVKGKRYISGGGFYIEPEIPVLPQEETVHGEYLVLSRF